MAKRRPWVRSLPRRLPICTNGTPVADMVVNSPPLPLVIDYLFHEDNVFTAEEEEGAIIALKQYVRVCRVRLWMPPTTLQKLIVAMDEEYPILEHLIMGCRSWWLCGATIDVTGLHLVREYSAMQMAITPRKRKRKPCKGANFVYCIKSLDVCGFVQRFQHLRR